MVKSDLLVYFFATAKFKQAASTSTAFKCIHFLKSVVGCKAKSTIEANTSRLE